MKLQLILISLFILFSGCNQVVVSGDFDEQVNLENGNVPVAIQDQHSEIIDLKLGMYVNNITLLDNYNIDDTLINISSVSLPVIDQMICLKEETAFYQGHIKSVTSLGGNNYEIGLDMPLDYPYTVLGGCSLREGNWAVDGSVTPQVFSVSPHKLENVSWDITRVILTCIGDGVGVPNDAPDLASFMVTDGPLNNGIVFRSVNGITKNIFGSVDNFHLIGEAYDLTFYDANKFGFYGAVIRRTFAGQDKNGVTIRLNSETDDRFELIIQDDLTDMEDCHAIAQGHVVER